MIYTIFSLLGLVTLALAVVALVAYAIKGDRTTLLYSMAAIALILGSACLASYAAPPTVKTSVLWNQVEQLGQAAGTGLGELTAVWPNVSTIDRELSRGKATTMAGGSFDIAPSLHVVRSRIRTENRQKLVLAEMYVEGRCVTRSEIESGHKPLKTTPPPTNPLPEIPRFYSLKTHPGIVLFGFDRDKKACLSRIILRPTAGKYGYTP